MKKYITLLLLVLSCSISKETASDKDELTYKMIKQYAFCRCMDIVYAQDEVFKNDGSTAAYFNTLDVGVDVFEVIDSLSKIYVDSVELLSKYEKKLGMMKCFEFHESIELEVVINQSLK